MRVGWEVEKWRCGINSSKVNISHKNPLITMNKQIYRCHNETVYDNSSSRLDPARGHYGTAADGHFAASCMVNGPGSRI